MKKLVKIAVIAVCTLFIGNFVQAQTKIGYINFSELVRTLPEFKTVDQQVRDYQKTFIDELTTMNNTLQAEAKDYDAKRASMTDAQRTAKEGELKDMQTRIQSFQNDAQQKIDAKTNELSKPLIDKGKAAVTEVAKEKGYTYVFDSSQGSPMIVSPEADDLMAAVKLKLGIK